jgi:pimeloyl-ACP methyl ester carboxylesterase
VPSDRTSQTLRLKDGRLLGYAEYGDPDGKPLFYFHGSPGSRLEAHLIEGPARLRGIRVLGFDRPGFGRSDFKPGRRILGWPDDVVQAADALGVERFAVLGASAGGPHVAACALKIPQRLTAAAIVSGVGPFDAPRATQGMMRWLRLLMRLARVSPWAVRPVMGLLSQVTRHLAGPFIWLQSRWSPPSDRALLAQTDFRAFAVQNVAEPFRRDSRGAAWELTLLARPWGFRLQDITMEIHLWQGEADVMVPPSMGHYQAQTIPNCHARFYPGGGHLLMVERIEEILGALFP